MSKFILLICCALSLEVCAKNTHIWEINRDHSEILFDVPFLGVSKVSGRFTHFSGKVYFDDDLLLVNKIQINIDPSSVYTANKMRDGHLQKKDFFNVKSYPSITFNSSKITALGPNAFLAKGILRIKNVQKVMIVKYSLTDLKKDTWNYKNKFASFSFKLKRSDFNLNWNKTIDNNEYLIGEVVNIHGTFQIQPSEGKTASTKFMIPDNKFIQLREKLNRGEISQSEFDNFNINSKNNEKVISIESQKNTIDKKKDEKVVQKEVVQYGRSFRDSTLWWISYFIMGAIGFVASIFLVFQGKNYTSTLFPRKYEETNVLGFLSDFIFYPIIFIYVWAMWYLGYG